MPNHRASVPSALALLALGATLLGGCGSRVVADQPLGAYSRGEVSYAASGRDLRVVIHGTPPGTDPQALGGAVTDAMAGHIMGVDTHFTTTPDDSARPDYKVVFAFNPVQPITAMTLCRLDPVPTRNDASGTVTVEAAFCRGGALTSATGWADAPLALDSPTFRSLIGDLTFALFPQDERDGGRDRCFFDC
ncbi:hypothetical protein [Azospirillum sp. A39]|uniref:hypothetical protein n=1 Tax=Azospirillum sp. A39 TaxID=3462279 RepID=UPI0040455475